MSFKLSCLGALVFCFMCLWGCAATPSRGGDSIEVGVNWIVPDVHTVEIDGRDVVTLRPEHEVLLKVENSRARATRCIVSVTLSNPGHASYLLSDWSVRSLFVHGTTFRDDGGGVWRLEYTFRSGHPDEVFYTLPCVAGVRKSFVLQLGLCRLVPDVEGTPDGGQIHFPKRLHYEVKSGIRVGCREIRGAQLAQPSSVLVSGTGTLNVEPNGHP